MKEKICKWPMTKSEHNHKDTEHFTSIEHNDQAQQGKSAGNLPSTTSLLLLNHSLWVYDPDTSVVPRHWHPTWHWKWWDLLAGSNAASPWTTWAILRKGVRMDLHGIAWMDVNWMQLYVIDVIDVPWKFSIYIYALDCLEPPWTPSAEFFGPWVGVSLQRFGSFLGPGFGLPEPAHNQWVAPVRWYSWVQRHKAIWRTMKQ